MAHWVFYGKPGIKKESQTYINCFFYNLVISLDIFDILLCYCMFWYTIFITLRFGWMLQFVLSLHKEDYLQILRYVSFW